MESKTQQTKSKKGSIIIIHVVVIVAFIYFIGYVIGQALAYAS
jgi:flagellar basal body-associated protein FliL